MEIEMERLCVSGQKMEELFELVKEEFEWQLQHHGHGEDLIDKSLDRTKCDSALSEVGHSSLEKAHPSRMLWGARSEKQLGSNKIFCQYLGDETRRLQGLSNIRSMNSKHFRGKRVSTTHQSGLMLSIVCNIYSFNYCCDNLLGPEKLQSWYRTKCDSALSEAGHSSLEEAHPSRTLWGARSELKLGSHQIVCPYLGDEIWRLHGLSNMSSINSNHLRGKRVCTTHQSRVMLLIFPKRDLLKRAQNYSPSLQTGTNLWKKLNILPSENHFPLENEESSVVVGIDLKMEAKKLDGKMTSEKLDYSSDCNLNKHKETMPKDHMFQPHDTFNQQKRKETTKRASCFVILAIVCIWFLLQTCSQTPHKYSVPTLMHVQALHKERGRVSIAVPLIGLFGFMAFVWAAAMMILVGAQFTRFHSAVFIFWAILMHVRPSTFQFSE